jgi:Flp pilus assembly protein TadD
LQLPNRGHVGHHGVAGRENRSKPQRRSSARGGTLSRSLPRQPQGRRRGPAIRKGASSRGAALADNGNFQQAFDVLSRAHTPDDPDWRILSAQGTALDQLGRHDEARQYYATALKIAPEEPSVLSNLGLSYVLSKDLPKAEETLRRAYSRADADPRVRQNLGLVIGLQGRLAEAEGIVKAGRPAEEAAANVAYLRRLLARKDNAHTASDKIPVAAIGRPI